jgi:hypothetical protein
MHRLLICTLAGFSTLKIGLRCQIKQILKCRRKNILSQNIFSSTPFLPPPHATSSLAKYSMYHHLSIFHQWGREG